MPNPTGVEEGRLCQNIPKNKETLFRWYLKVNTI